MTSGFLKATQQFSPLSSLYIVHMEMLLLSPWNTTVTPVVFLRFEVTNSLSELFFLPTFLLWRRRFPTVRSVFNNKFYIQFFLFDFSSAFLSGCFRSKNVLIASQFNNISFSRKWSVTLSFHISLYPRRAPISSHGPADLSILIDCVAGEKRLAIIITNARHIGQRAACLAATA